MLTLKDLGFEKDKLKELQEIAWKQIEIIMAQNRIKPDELPLPYISEDGLFSYHCNHEFNKQNIFREITIGILATLIYIYNLEEKIETFIKK